MDYALALGKKLYGYVTRLDTAARRVEIAERRKRTAVSDGEPLTNRRGMLIENFNLPCNLMLAAIFRFIQQRQPGEPHQGLVIIFWQA